MRAFDLPGEWEEMAVRAAAAVEVDYGGVDLLPGPSGRVYVIEVNGIPGWKGLQGCTGTDVAGAVAERVLARARGPSTAERFRQRIRELEELREASSDEDEREALRRDIEHLEAGLRAVERSG